jgi:murein DD-endopeptidase MepM/ murein hydrolase activator NlpD
MTVPSDARALATFIYIGRKEKFGWLRLARGIRRALSAICIVGGFSCRDTSGPADPTIADFVVAVRTAGNLGTATLHTGALPQGGAGPSISATELGAFILGGTAPVQISASIPFTKLLIGLEGVRGYWELSMPSSTRASLYLTLGQELATNQLSFAYAASNGDGIGAYVTKAVNVKTVGTGDIQVSISWDVLSDLDLHVVDPNGEHIYFGNKGISGGGQLDLDSNPACNIDAVNNENITWATDKAIPGQYRVYVNLYASCGTSVTTYAVTVTKRGEIPQVYFGTATAATPTSRGTLVTTVTYGSTSNRDKFTWPTDRDNTSNGFYASCNENPQCFWITANGWRDVQPFLRYHYVEGAKVYGYHLGADWNLGSGAADKGLPVYAVADGEIVEVLTDWSGWGNIVFIRHSTSFGEYTSMYAHVDWMDSGPPARGPVSRRETIAKIGNGNGRYGYHLHFEIRRGRGETVGPGYVPTQGTPPPQNQLDPNAFIAAHR